MRPAQGALSADPSLMSSTRPVRVRVDRVKLRRVADRVLLRVRVRARVNSIFPHGGRLIADFLRSSRRTRCVANRGSGICRLGSSSG